MAGAPTTDRTHGPSCAARHWRLLWALGAALVLGTLLFLYRHLSHVTENDDTPFLKPLIEELTASFSAAALFFLVRPLALRFRLDRRSWHRSLPWHVLGVVAFGLTLTTMMWASRNALFPLSGLGPYDYGPMRWRYPMEFPVQIIIYGLMVTGVYVGDHRRRARARELRAAQLESQLSRAQLENLHLRLQPHFLFNALNTISSTMYDDPAAADEMLSQLAELLRVSLRATETQEVPLRDELQTLDAYLSIMRARFGDGLVLERSIDPGCLDFKVPSLLVQPLVENAIRHGGIASRGEGRITLQATCDGSLLRIRVEDEGPSAPDASAKRTVDNKRRGIHSRGADDASPNGTGLGLALTRERLRLLYGEEQSLAAGPSGDGFRVEITLPARSAAAEVPA